MSYMTHRMDEDTWVSTQQLKEFQDDSTSHAGKRMSVSTVRVAHSVIYVKLLFEHQNRPWYLLKNMS